MDSILWMVPPIIDREVDTGNLISNLKSCIIITLITGLEKLAPNFCSESKGCCVWSLPPQQFEMFGGKIDLGWLVNKGRETSVGKTLKKLLIRDCIFVAVLLYGAEFFIIEQMIELGATPSPFQAGGWQSGRVPGVRGPLQHPEEVSRLFVQDRAWNEYVPISRLLTRRPK